MKHLPAEIKALRRIKKGLDKLLCNNGMQIEIRSNNVYEDIIRKDVQLKEQFPEPQNFNRFLRLQYNTGILKQIIPNCRVDTSINYSYKWYFYKDTPEKKLKKGKDVETVGSKLYYYKSSLKILSSDGTKFRSDQEKQIYEQLIRYDHLTIEYEHPIVKNGEKRFVDFKILNRANQKLYYWEHFGMTNSCDYLDTMTEKIQWYKKNGFKTIEDKGNLIFTIYYDEKQLQRDIDKHIRLITEITDKP
jgi:hypothetical protein